MSNTITFETSPRSAVAEKPANRLVARFYALMESLVAAQSRRLSPDDSAFYRFPPF